MLTHAHRRWGPAARRSKNVYRVGIPLPPSLAAGDYVLRVDAPADAGSGAAALAFFGSSVALRFAIVEASRTATLFAGGACV